MYHTTCRADRGAATAEAKGQKSDPEKHQSTNGNDWHFDQKPVSVDAASAFVHAVFLIAGDATNATRADALLLGDVVAGIG
jgi:hypothetical protein